ncbi:MAG TPA: hypothetical protein VLD67_13700 [Vicinamibacterales bacterium]|nr:hypothetical protein [Vicinamibacterales bacterium]
MPDSLSALMSEEVNRAVLAYLQDKSAHSDITAVLERAVEPLGDVQLYSPDPSAYRYVVASTKSIIFGFVVGMNTMVFRLDERMRERAIATGGIAYPECGAEWVAVLDHRPDSDWPAVDVRFWARKAYVYARGMNAR